MQGLLKLNPLEIDKKCQSRSQIESSQANKLAPLIRRHHLLLVSMLLVHTTAMELLPLALNNLVPPVVAVLLSVALVLLAGEILPAIVLAGMMILCI